MCLKQLSVCAWRVVGALVVGLALTTWAQADLVVSGSFENPDIPLNEAVSGEAATGWTRIPGFGAAWAGAGYASNGYPFLQADAPDGEQAGMLRGGGGMSQDVSGFDTSKQYTLSFFAAARPYEGKPDGTPFKVSLNSTALVFGSSDVVTPDIVYNEYACTFTPTSSTMTLEFRTTQTEDIDLTSFIDNVQISEVPEPAAVALLTTGLIGLLAYAWRKRR